MSTIKELFSLIGKYAPSLSILPVAIFIALVLTTLLAFYFNRHRWVKFIPGIVAMTYGLISGLAVWDKFYNKDALYKAWYSIIFAVAGFISIAFALLLQMYMKKRKKTKKQVNRKKTLKKNTDNVKKNKELDYDIEQVKRRFSALDKKLENDSKEELNKESNSVKTREKAYFSPAKSSTISFHLKKDEDFEATKFRTKKFRREIQNKLNEDRTFDDELKSNFNKSLDKKFKDNKIVIGKEKKINRVTINKDYE